MICLYVIDNNRKLYFSRGTFYINTNDCKEKKIVSAPLTGFRLFFSYFRLTTRLLRLEPRCVERLDENRFIVCYAHKVWLLDITHKTFTILQETRNGFSTPLNLIADGRCVYWGDYGKNAKREAVNIYCLDCNLSLKTVYTFASGEVRHIHNIVKYEDGFIVMVGDNETKAGFYKANQEWTHVVPWKTGEQRYRAVVGFAHKNDFLYATDSVETDNQLRIIIEDGVEKNVADINGSCIYGCETKCHYIFSTTVEPHEGSVWKNKLGGGIKSRDVHLIAVNKTDLNVQIIKTFRKDIWPMKLFQYGTLIFPKGQEACDELCYNIVACERDGKIETITL